MLRTDNDPFALFLSTPSPPETGCDFESPPLSLSFSLPAFAGESHDLKKELSGGESRSNVSEGGREGGDEKQQG